jgi:DNA-binding MarR family transcriptional regulator
VDLVLSRTLHALVATLDRAADRILRTGFGISYSQFLTLYAIKDCGGGTQREIAAWLGTTEPATSRSVRALAVDGLAVIGPSTAGGHRRTVELTSRGRDLVQSGGAHLEHRLAEVLAAADVDYEDYAVMTQRLLTAVTGPRPASSQVSPA